MPITALHSGLAWLAALLAAIVGLLAALALRPGRRPHRLAIDRAILALEAVVLANIVVGMGFVAGGDGPGDPLHVIYAVVALLALPVARTWHGLADGFRPKLLLVAAAVVLGVLVRLAQTG